MYIRLVKSWSWRNYRWDDYKHVSKKNKKQKKKTKKNTVSPTLSISAVVHFILFLLCILKTRNKPNEYEQEIPQSFTADKDQAWSNNAFYKTTESIPFRTQIVCTKMCVRFSTFCLQCCSRALERFCCLLCWGDTLHVESSILHVLMSDVVYDARFSVCNKRNIFRHSVGHNYSPYYNVAV